MLRLSARNLRKQICQLLSKNYSKRQKESSFLRSSPKLIQSNPRFRFEIFNELRNQGTQKLSSDQLQIVKDSLFKIYKNHKKQEDPLNEFYLQKSLTSKVAIFFEVIDDKLVAQLFSSAQDFRERIQIIRTLHLFEEVFWLKPVQENLSRLIQDASGQQLVSLMRIVVSRVISSQLTSLELDSELRNLEDVQQKLLANLSIIPQDGLASIIQLMLQANQILASCVHKPQFQFEFSAILRHLRQNVPSGEANLIAKIYLKLCQAPERQINPPLASYLLEIRGLFLKLLPVTDFEQIGKVLWSSAQLRKDDATISAVKSKLAHDGEKIRLFDLAMLLHCLSAKTLFPQPQDLENLLQVVLSRVSRNQTLSSEAHDQNLKGLIELAEILAQSPPLRSSVYLKIVELLTGFFEKIYLTNIPKLLRFYSFLSAQEFPGDTSLAQELVGQQITLLQDKLRQYFDKNFQRINNNTLLDLLVCLNGFRDENYSLSESKSPRSKELAPGKSQLLEKVLRCLDSRMQTLSLAQKARALQKIPPENSLYTVLRRDVLSTQSGLKFSEMVEILRIAEQHAKREHLGIDNSYIRFVMEQAIAQEQIQITQLTQLAKMQISSNSSITLSEPQIEQLEKHLARAIDSEPADCIDLIRYLRWQLCFTPSVVALLEKYLRQDLDANSNDQRITAVTLIELSKNGFSESWPEELSQKIYVKLLTTYRKDPPSNFWDLIELLSSMCMISVEAHVVEWCLQLIDAQILTALPNLNMYKKQDIFRTTQELRMQYPSLSIESYKNLASVLEGCEKLYFNYKSLIKLEANTTQLQVRETLHDLKISFEEEKIIGIYFVDFFIKPRTCIEFEGKMHFRPNSKILNNLTLKKHRYLKNLGYNLIHIPYYDWQEISQSSLRYTYLKGLLN